MTNKGNIIEGKIVTHNVLESVRNCIFRFTGCGICHVINYLVKRWFGGLDWGRGDGEWIKGVGGGDGKVKRIDGIDWFYFAESDALNVSSVNRASI